MKLVTFTHDGVTHIGKLVSHNGQESVVDLNAAQPSLPTTMLAFLEGGSVAQKLAEQVPVESALPLSSVKLHAPIPRPGKIICIGRNYAEHARESGYEVLPHPIVFAKYANTVIGPYDHVILPKVSNRVDYEAELGVAVGRRGRYISESDALEYVAGYFIANDVSARDYQNRTSQWTIGKTFDTFAPMGPALVTPDEIADPHNLDIRLTIGNEVLQDYNTRYMIFNIPRLLASLSETMTLEPGDVVLTGTPPGIGDARKPPRYLQDGETVEITIEKLGTLSNPIVAES